MPVRRGRPRLRLDADRLHQLQQQGWSLRRIARFVGATKDTVRNTLKTLSINSQDVTSSEGPYLPPMGVCMGGEVR